MGKLLLVPFLPDRELFQRLNQMTIKMRKDGSGSNTWVEKRVLQLMGIAVPKTAPVESAFYPGQWFNTSDLDGSAPTVDAWTVTKQRIPLGLFGMVVGDRHDARELQARMRQSPDKLRSVFWVPTRLLRLGRSASAPRLRNSRGLFTGRDGLELVNAAQTSDPAAAEGLCLKIRVPQLYGWDGLKLVSAPAEAVALYEAIRSRDPAASLTAQSIVMVPRDSLPREALPSMAILHHGGIEWALLSHSRPDLADRLVNYRPTYLNFQQSLPKNTSSAKLREVLSVHGLMTGFRSYTWIPANAAAQQGLVILGTATIDGVALAHVEDDATSHATTTAGTTPLRERRPPGADAAFSDEVAEDDARDVYAQHGEGDLQPAVSCNDTTSSSYTAAVAAAPAPSKALMKKKKKKKPDAPPQPVVPEEREEAERAEALPDAADDDGDNMFGGVAAALPHFDAASSNL